MNAWERALGGWLVAGSALFADAVEKPVPEDWVGEELHFAWRAAESEAALALGHWSRTSEEEAYVVYRAAQDRADAAQDALADWHRGRAGWGSARALPSSA